jgi:CRISPR/Cas system-associated exonuclease Cas4 (RecB family)
VILQRESVTIGSIFPEDDGLMIRSWSYSRLVDFEQCKYRAKLKYLDKIPEPARALPPGKSEHANDRGTRVHEGAELFVKGGVELLPELEFFREELTTIRDLYKKGKVSLEGEWAYDRDWIPTAWSSEKAWLRLKIDALVTMSPTHMVLIDYKTGKRAYNEMKHAEQCQLYQLATFLRYPKVEKITTELYYLDLDQLTSMTYTRAQGMRFLKGYQDRGLALTSATDFPPNPTAWACKWCPFGVKGTGHCQVGIQ